mmetsp:Transcript_32286/g.64092  ORF Transcript_32286/g.64092 Transcript_32286/m.64092 type:complete len:224 (-) Transcript_32286:1385-2056(-)
MEGEGDWGARVDDKSLGGGESAEIWFETGAAKSMRDSWATKRPQRASERGAVGVEEEGSVAEEEEGGERSERSAESHSLTSSSTKVPLTSAAEMFLFSASAAATSGPDSSRLHIHTTCTAPVKHPSTNRGSDAPMSWSVDATGIPFVLLAAGGSDRCHWGSWGSVSSCSDPARPTRQPMSNANPWGSLSSLLWIRARTSTGVLVLSKERYCWGASTSILLVAP